MDFDPDSNARYIFKPGPHVLTNERNFWQNLLRDDPDMPTFKRQYFDFFATHLNTCAGLQYSQPRDIYQLADQYTIAAGILATSRLFRLLIGLDSAVKFVVDYDYMEPASPGLHMPQSDMEQFGLTTSDNQPLYFENPNLYVKASFPADFSPQMLEQLPSRVDPNAYATVTPRVKMSTWAAGRNIGQSRLN